MLPSSEPDGEGDTIEILVRNDATERTRVAVRIEDETGAALFSRVYDLRPGHLDSSAGIETRPATVSAFTPDGRAATWEYDPDVDLSCEGFDVGVTVTDDAVESWYSC